MRPYPALQCHHPGSKAKMAEEFRLIRKYNLAGFLLLYHEVIKWDERL